MLKKYYFLTCEYEPYMCKVRKFSVVISEEPEAFDLRMKKCIKRRSRGDRFDMGQWKEIGEKAYDKAKLHNPTNESYIEMKILDYSKFLK